MSDKGICDKGCIWNPSNCECECDKSCDVGEYLHYKNCKCRKKLVHALVEECTENIDDVKIAKIALAVYENVCKSSCTIYTVLFSIVFTINIRIGTYFVYYKYMNHDKKSVASESFIYPNNNLIKWNDNIITYEMTTDVKSINIKNRTYYCFNDMINIEYFLKKVIYLK